MTRLTLLTVLVLSLLSTPVFADWTKVSKNVYGTTFYVDFDRIRKHGGYVYWWELTDRLKPDKWGDLSDKTYRQGDCKLFRYKTLSDSYHKEPMGEGAPSKSSNEPDKEWGYPHPNSGGELTLKSVCAYAK
jgi:hypothetical protein